MKLIKRKERGQAFSTFQLLIAAVVALALLGVLMPIIGNINPGTGRVIEALKERINTQQDQPGALSLTDSLKVSGKKDKLIGTATITEGTGLSDDQVIFYHNDHTSDFSTENGDLMILTDSTVTYRFGVICHINAVDLEQKINQLISGTNSIIKGGISDISFEELSEDGRACLVFPVKQ
jgi:hypothetical protein